MDSEYATYFISDAHLGNFSGSKSREKVLTSFLREIRDSASHLFILGDLFDFWIEYTHAIRPHYFSILHEFRLLIESGVSIHYLAGNHDFALGSFLEKTIGVHISMDSITIVLQGKKLFLRHGDGMLGSDNGYNLIRRILRNSFNQRLYKMLHPNIGIPLATFVSNISRKTASNRYTEEKRKAYLSIAQKYLDSNFDMVLFGHTHRPEIYNLDGKIYCNVGDWMRSYTYGKLENGKLELCKYHIHSSPVTLKYLFE